MAQETAVHKINLYHEKKFQGDIKIKHFSALRIDEPLEMGGDDSAPSPVEYLLAAVGGCLMNSLAFCFQKKRIEAGLSVEAEAELGRNEEKMLRVIHIKCTMKVKTPEVNRAKVENCFEVFKKYCVVSASIAQGIKVDTYLALES